MIIKENLQAKSWLDSMTRLLLIAGTWLSFTLLFIGGLTYLYQFGYQQMDTITATSYTSFSMAKLTSLPLDLIIAGLLLLVVIQVLRVGLLCIYYISIKDKWFIAISSFIFLVLIYSLLYSR
jgi:uncharacterized membrane protein